MYGPYIYIYIPKVTFGGNYIMSCVSPVVYFPWVNLNILEHQSPICTTDRSVSYGVSIGHEPCESSNNAWILIRDGNNTASI